IANPPFNDGSKGEDGWGSSRIASDDPRLTVNGERLPLAARNANTMWMLHFLHHLSDTGSAGFVMATGELSNSETSRLAVRQALIEADVIDCIVQMPGQLFANTQIPCSLWFLAKNRSGTGGTRDRRGKVLFIDARTMGKLFDGSRKQKTLADDEIERIAAMYREFKRDGEPDAVPGFVAVASTDEIREHRFALTPGRYVGAEVGLDDGEPFEERLIDLKSVLTEQMSRSAQLSEQIEEVLGALTGE
ncbi:MAG: N-6 DNA methylase, partial [Phycisphaerales bacterium]|nr:N-6 DNA methylase [Phycisphaerales bacterium]